MVMREGLKLMIDGDDCAFYASEKVFKVDRR